MPGTSNMVNQQQLNNIAVSPKTVVGPFAEASGGQKRDKNQTAVNQNFNRYIRQSYNKSTSITGNNIQQQQAQI